MLETIIFDFDMTLIDSSDAMLQSLTMLSRKFDLPQMTRPRLMEIIGFHTEKFWQHALGDFRPEFIEFYLKECSHREVPLLKPFEGTVACLHRLKKAGLHVALASNRDHPARVVEDVGLSSMFDCVVGAGDVKRPKPAADMIDLVLERTGTTDRSKALYVGDTDIDVVAGRNAGVKTVVFCTSTKRQVLQNASPWRICEAINELEGLLETEGLLRGVS